MALEKARDRTRIHHTFPFFSFFMRIHIKVVVAEVAMEGGFEK